MNKVEKFDGSWTKYYDILSKLITEDNITKNWNFFLECYQLKAMPERAVSWL
tara:strand:+ start:524 stop:679 length:156 start_codon:yes stop_codon:yes gene_type:complete